MKADRACLQMDVGNSSAKWRLLDSGRVVKRGRYVIGDVASESQLLDCTEQLQEIWISSVASAAAETGLRELLLDRWGVDPWFARSASRTGTLVNSYAEPGRMGVDRWLAMLGGRERNGGRIAVIDAGSALTIDIVASSGEHEGGYIIPGANLMERALLLDTDRVRFDDDVQYQLGPGNSTAEAVRHGIALSQAGAVALSMQHEGIDEADTLYCGGGAETLMGLLGHRRGVYAPDLVFEGLEVMVREVARP